MKIPDVIVQCPDCGAKVRARIETCEVTGPDGLELHLHPIVDEHHCPEPDEAVA